MTQHATPLPAPGPHAARAAERASGYALSSLDLRAGLVVSLLAVADLPAEVLRELQRQVRAGA